KHVKLVLKTVEVVVVMVHVIMVKHVKLVQRIVEPVLLTKPGSAFLAITVMETVTVDAVFLILIV
ncbi:hypothetical protein JXA12_03990, partial [Candidatus Woesearchaeota archaeon]|nr:hypothetical protein [Candidatus Woesearchaeota archaeon]